MRTAITVALVVAASLAAGCGKEIGDECIDGNDCSNDGDRICDVSSEAGYCTIQGCDYNTCPEEAACIRFFSGNFSNRPCDPLTENATTDDCSLDELCSLVGRCVPRSSEVRYCMRQCSDDSDCREGYECRGLGLQIEHGGEPVLAPGTPLDSRAPKFCASRPS